MSGSVTFIQANNRLSDIQSSGPIRSSDSPNALSNVKQVVSERTVQDGRGFFAKVGHAIKDFFSGGSTEARLRVINSTADKLVSEIARGGLETLDPKIVNRFTEKMSKVTGYPVGSPELKEEIKAKLGEAAKFAPENSGGLKHFKSDDYYYRGQNMITELKKKLGVDEPDEKSSNYFDQSLAANRENFRMEVGRIEKSVTTFMAAIGEMKFA